MSAVRMVAYGVLDLTEERVTVKRELNESPEEAESRKARQFERDQIRKLVGDELKSYGLLLDRKVRRTYPFSDKGSYVLYGQLITTGAPRRPVLYEGDFKYCCIEAAKVLDALDASQVPDTATGL